MTHQIVLKKLKLGVLSAILLSLLIFVGCTTTDTPKDPIQNTGKSEELEKPEPGLEIKDLRQLLANHFYFPPRAPLASQIFTVLPPGSIKLEGPLKEKLEGQLNTLTKDLPSHEADTQKLETISSLAASLGDFDLLKRLEGVYLNSLSLPSNVTAAVHLIAGQLSCYRSTSNPQNLELLVKRFKSLLALNPKLFSESTRETRTRLLEVAVSIYNQTGDTVALGFLENFKFTLKTMPAADSPQFIHAAHDLAHDPFSSLIGKYEDEIQLKLRMIRPGTTNWPSLSPENLKLIKESWLPIQAHTHNTAWNSLVARSLQSIDTDNVSIAELNMVQRIWMATAGDGLALMSFQPSTVEASVGEDAGVFVHLKLSKIPGEDQAFWIEIEPQSQVEFPISIPVFPEVKSINVSLNRRKAVSAMSNSYLTISRKWRSGDRLRIEIVHPPNERPN